jgi:hypothetical protein
MLASSLQKARSASAAEQEEDDEDEQMLPQTTHEPSLQVIGPLDPGIRLRHIANHREHLKK